MNLKSLNSLKRNHTYTNKVPIMSLVAHSWSIYSSCLIILESSFVRNWIRRKNLLPIFNLTFLSTAFLSFPVLHKQISWFILHEDLQAHLTYEFRSMHLKIGTNGGHRTTKKCSKKRQKNINDRILLSRNQLQICLCPEHNYKNFLKL